MIRIRFEIPATRDQFEFEMNAVPREGESVYLFIKGHRRLFIVRRVVWFPSESDDFDVYVVLKRPS